MLLSYNYFGFSAWLAKAPWTLIFPIFLGVITYGSAEHTDHVNLGKHSVTEEHEGILSFTGAWDSKYVSEGRDNLDSGGLASVAAEWSSHFDSQDLFLTSWYAESTDTSYTELNLGIGYGINLEEGGVNVGYTWLDFADDDESDNDISLELTTNTLEAIDLTAAFVYSTEASGTWIELIASTEFERNPFTIAPYALLGINKGYVANEYDGLNNLQLGIDISTPLNEKVSLGGYLTYIIALDDDHDETLDDIFWLGVYLEFGN
tara:strand:- start:1771 stop:2556 length:786 start_codon:yes stop_codon:yes gene_type:complete